MDLISHGKDSGKVASLVAGNWTATIDGKYKIMVWNHKAIGGACDYPVMYDDGRIAYDHPELIPAYAKKLAYRAFVLAKKLKEIND